MLKNNTVIMGVDAGLTLPGIALVRVTETEPTGTVLHAEGFAPEWKLIPGTKKLAKLGKTEHDVWRIGQICRHIFDLAGNWEPTVIVAELPTGGAKSSSAIRGMAYSTAMTTAALEAIQRYHNPNIEVVYISPLDNKKGSTGRRKWNVEAEQSKWEVFAAVNAIWPGLTWPMKKRNPTEHDDSKCWAISDALSCVATYLRRQGHLPPLE